LFSLISAEGCEDIVGLYLQERGYRIIPSSCKSDTQKYEFVMKHTHSKKSAVVQVKTGNEVLNIDEFKDIGHEVYLFATSGKYVGNRIKNIHCIEPKDINSFIMKNINLLPEKIQKWLDYYKKMGENASLL
jgi:tRNA nucleotidyltransferase (CCA-adding enzyme)